MRTATQIFAIAALLDQTNGWWGNGHLLTSRVAFEILQKDSPDTVTQVENILKVLKVSDPSWTKSEDTHPMIECVTFADDIKHKGGAYQSGWHFIDTPFLDEGGDISDYDFTFDAHNVTEAITAIGSWINKDDGYTNTFEYEQIQKNGMKGHSEADGLSTAMRLILHYVGDIHQPLHATSRVNHEFPQGDRGGNSVPLPSVDGAKNLHSVWDSVVYSQTSDYNLVSLTNIIFNVIFNSHSPQKTGTLSVLMPRDSWIPIQSKNPLLQTSMSTNGPKILSKSLPLSSMKVSINLIYLMTHTK